VLEPGLHTRIVDRGRLNHRSLGVPVGGAADRWAFQLGNALLGNPPDAAALEITLAGPVLQAACPLACVLFGAPFQMHGHRRKQVGTTFTLEEGEVLHIEGTADGARAYFCVGGGIPAPIILGSRSSEEPLRGGEVWCCAGGRTASRFLRAGLATVAERGHLRTLDGPQADWFPAGALYTSPHNVLPASDRMGLRLAGVPLPWPDQELLSEPVCPGSIQVTRDGQCIVLGVDGQTIGGYPKIGQVIQADVDRLGQLRPGDRITFERVDLAEAERLYRERQAELAEWLLRLQVAETFAS
jgi:biotin-dependent carboxylase-like uncharacterized protein